MTLLTEMLQRPLDPGYAAAASRRLAAGEPAHTPVGTALVTLTAVLIGLVFAVAASAVRREAPRQAAVRLDVIAQVEQRRALVEERSRAISERQGEIAALEARILGAGGGGQIQAELDALALASGAMPVQGPGLVISLADRPGEPQAEEGGIDQGRIQSRDLFIVVNALWESGAEAIAIKGQRLTVRSPIRFAGSAILVNFRPLTPPYEVSAIGDPARLPGRFAATLGASYLKSLSDNFGIVTSIEAAPELTLPGATRVNVDRARPLGGAS